MAITPKEAKAIAKPIVLPETADEIYAKHYKALKSTVAWIRAIEKDSTLIENSLAPHAILQLKTALENFRYDRGLTKTALSSTTIYSELSQEKMQAMNAILIEAENIEKNCKQIQTKAITKARATQDAIPLTAKPQTSTRSFTFFKKPSDNKSAPTADLRKKAVIDFTRSVRMGQGEELEYDAYINFKDKLPQHITNVERLSSSTERNNSAVEDLRAYRDDLADFITSDNFKKLEPLEQGELTQLANKANATIIEAAKPKSAGPPPIPVIIYGSPPAPL